MPITINGTGNITGLTSGAGIASTALSGQVPDANAPSGSVIQVVSTTKTDTFSSSTLNAWTDITGLTLNITPSNSSNKIMILASVQGINAGSNTYFRIVRNSTAVGVGDASGSRSQVSSSNVYSTAGNGMLGSTFQFFDSPSTTSSTTYKIQFITDFGTVLINRTPNNDNALYAGLSQSTITVMEIAA